MFLPCQIKLTTSLLIWQHWSVNKERKDRKETKEASAKLSENLARLRGGRQHNNSLQLGRRDRILIYIERYLFELYSGETWVHVKVTLHDSKVSDLEDDWELNAGSTCIGAADTSRRQSYLIIWWISPKPLRNRHSWIDNLLAQKATLAGYQAEKRAITRLSENLGRVNWQTLKPEKKIKKRMKPLLDYQKTLPNWIKWIKVHV